jgi:hypothetical protein
VQSILATGGMGQEVVSLRFPPTHQLLPSHQLHPLYPHLLTVTSPPFFKTFPNFSCRAARVRARATEGMDSAASRAGAFARYPTKVSGRFACKRCMKRIEGKMFRLMFYMDFLQNTKHEKGGRSWMQMVKSIAATLYDAR